jgi:hypothetical protein
MPRAKDPADQDHAILAGAHADETGVDGGIERDRGRHLYCRFERAFDLFPLSCFHVSLLR